MKQQKTIKAGQKGSKTIFIKILTTRKKQKLIGFIQDFFSLTNFGLNTINKQHNNIVADGSVGRIPSEMLM